MKQEWPLHWPTFIDDIVGASKTSEPLCTNNMAILKLLRYAREESSCQVVLLMPKLVHFQSFTVVKSSSDLVKETQTITHHVVRSCTLIGRLEGS